MENRTFVALCAPSTGGKTTLANFLKKKNNFTAPEHFTTRDKRNGEIIESGYTHISEQVFIGKIKDGSINIFTVFNGNLYGYNADSTIHNKVVFVIEPKGVAHLERYCIENRIRLVSVFIQIDEEERKKRFIKREGNLVNYRLRKETDDCISALGPKYCDNILYSSGGPEMMHKKLVSIIENEEKNSLHHNLIKLGKKIHFHLKNTLLDINTND